MPRTKQLRNLKHRLWHEQGGACYYCGKPMLLAKGSPNGIRRTDLATIDHIVPKSRGGALSGNAVAACYKCNHERGDMDARIFLLQKAGAL